jgi:glycosyltransferase involved in cell wall biosynthesis
MPRIVILSGIQIIDNPRVVKEADALAELGHEVEVVGAIYNQPSKELIDAALAGKKWKHIPVIDLTDGKIGPRLKSLALRSQSKLSHFKKKLRGSDSPIQLGFVARKLYATASALNADLYVAHLEQALWVGAKLLSQGRAVALDVEDWYSEDGLPEDRAKRPIHLMKVCEKLLLRGACYSTTTSQALASALARTYDCPPPAVVYNSFPIEDRHALDGKVLDRKRSDTPSLTWFSQTIGPGRGLEELLAVLPRLRHRLEVHLRGSPRSGFQDHLLNAVPKCLRAQIHFHPRVAQKDLLSRLSEHDIGYCGELSDCLSRDLTITNKMFEYMRAGLALVASDTTGQSEVAAAVPDAVSLFRQRDPESLTRTLDALLGDPSKLQHAKLASGRALKERYEWKASKEILQRLCSDYFESRPRRLV